MNLIRFFLYLILAYLTVVYFWSKYGDLSIREVESQIWFFLSQWWKENTQDTLSSNSPCKTVPTSYGEKIHDAIKDYTGNDFNFTFWKNGTFSEYHVPCYTLEIVPKNNDIDNDLPIIEVLALDRFQKCTLNDQLLASRIKSEKSLGKVFLHFLYASNVDELHAYYQLLLAEKQYADNTNMRNAAPVADSTLSEALNLFDDSVCGDTYAQH